MAVVLDVVRRVDARDRLELGDPALRRGRRTLTRLPGFRPGASPSTSSVSCPVRPSDVGALSGQELERHDAHADEVAAVDALEALRDHGAHAEQQRALRRPVARRAGAVLLARDHDQRHALLL